MTSTTLFTISNPKSQSSPYNQPNKRQAQAVVWNLEAIQEPDLTKKFVLKFGAILLRSFDRVERGET